MAILSSQEREERSRRFHEICRRTPKIGCLTGVLEFVGGMAVFLGVLTVLAATLFTLEMVATTWLAHVKLGKKYVLGYELDTAYLGGAILLALVGADSVSVDALLP